MWLTGGLGGYETNDYGQCRLKAYGLRQTHCKKWWLKNWLFNFNKLLF